MADPKLPQKPLDYIQVSWGGGMPGPVGGKLWRVYTDDSLYYYETRWAGDEMTSNAIGGVYTEALTLLGAVDRLASLREGKDCMAIDYGVNRIEYRKGDTVIQYDFHCPSMVDNLGQYGEAFYAIYTPLRDMLRKQD